MARVEVDRTREVLDGIRADVEAIEARTAADVAATARANVRSARLVDTGALLDGIRAERTGPLVWLISAPGHGRFAEHGTRYLPARPWFTPAAVSAHARIRA